MVKSIPFSLAIQKEIERRCINAGAPAEVIMMQGLLTERSFAAIVSGHVQLLINGQAVWRDRRMTTPILMLILMTTPYFAARVFAALTHRGFDGRGAASLGLGILFIFTGVGHFIETEPMARMLPPWVPQRILLIHLTGVLEFAIAAGFMVPRTRKFSGRVAAVVLVLFFPANIYAAIHHVPMGGHAWGPVYLLIRAPLQVMILFWVYWFTIR